MECETESGAMVWKYSIIVSPMAPLEGSQCECDEGHPGATPTAQKMFYERTTGGTLTRI
jgi:hypothetical protein